MKNTAPNLWNRIAMSFFLLLFALTPIANATPTTTQQTNEQIVKKVDAYLKQLTSVERFSGSVLIAKKGKVLIEKGYGWADKKKGIINTAETKYNIASLTKQFTSFAVMKLQAEQKLSVQDPISKYIPDYPNGDKITIHHLLSLTSGIPDYITPEFFQSQASKITNAEQLVTLFKNKPLQFSPGEKYDYSNANYTLLGYLIEKISGKSYGDYIKEYIFDPAGMTNSGYNASFASLPNSAIGNIYGEESLIPIHDPYIHAAYAAGGLYSTVRDLYLWDRILLTDKLLNKNDFSQVFVPVKDGYGYGWEIVTTGKRKIIWHNGSNPRGYTASLSRFPDDDVTIIFMNNIRGIDEKKIRNNLTSIVFGEPFAAPKIYKEVKVNPKIFDSYLGKYELMPGGILEITKKDNKLFAQFTGQEKFRIYPLSTTSYFYKNIEDRINFVDIRKGKAYRITGGDTGKEFELKRITK
ncbi:serine hydrolase [Brevibacillus brevis]|uniref:serine hydrolase n=1 Tax=Brevibacillus brevis TaxID=1393 RepID=UPI0037CAED44